MKQQILKIIKNRNFFRAAIIYIGSLIIGGIGLLMLGKNGWYIMTCVPGFASGFAAALLSNGHQKPVTVKSILTTICITTFFATVCWLAGIPVPAFLIGTALSFVGSFAGLSFCKWENYKTEKKSDNQDSAPPKASLEK